MDVDLGTPFLRGRHDDGVLTVTIDRPERKNACTMEMYAGIRQAARLADADPAIDVVVLTGSGDSFCPGGDMSGGPGGGVKLDLPRERWDDVPFVALERCAKLVVCAVNGLCQGGGLDLVLTSDVTIASDRARFRAPELLRGIPDPWLSARLAAHVGLARAKYLMLAAPVVSAAEAAAMGLVARVVAHEELASAVSEVVRELRAAAPRAASLVKRDVVRSLPAIDLEMFLDALGSEEVAEGFRAFNERRAPRWRSARAPRP